MRYTTLLLLSALIWISPLGAQTLPTEDWNETDNLPRYLTPSEMERLDEIGKGFQRSSAPEGLVRSIAEFERMEGALIRFPLGIPVALVAAMSEHVKVYTLVSGNWQQNQATNTFTNGGVNMENVVFITAPTNSIWTRDYGPWYIATEDDKIEIVDFIYNRPRASDNNVPIAVAEATDIHHYSMDLVHCGGNFMVDGLGIGASTDLVEEENGFDLDRILENMWDFLGVHTYHITEDAQGEYIRHIDTWAKFLDVDKILIAEVPELHPRYHVYEYIAEYYANQISSYGTPFEVYRVYSPQGQPYTNSLILNERVYVPITNSPWDEEALKVYSEAMPGYDVRGFTGSWISTDALHCRVKDMADRHMLYIEHKPLAKSMAYRDTISLVADIIPYSGADLVTDSLYLFSSINDQPYDTILLESLTDRSFKADIVLSPGDTSLSYYFYAVDESSKTSYWPLVGKDGARQTAFTYEPDIRFDLDTIFFSYEDIHFIEREVVFTNHTPTMVAIDSVILEKNGNFPVQIFESPENGATLSAAASQSIALGLSLDEMNDWTIEKEAKLKVYSGSMMRSVPVIWIPIESTSALGALDIKDNQLSIFPNPVDHLLNVSMSGDVDSSGMWQIIDIHGKLHLSSREVGQPISNNIFTLDIGNKLMAGTYIFQFVDRSGTVWHGSFIKK